MLAWLKWIGTGMGIAGALVIALNLPFSGWGFVLFLVSSVSWTVRMTARWPVRVIARAYPQGRIDGSVAGERLDKSGRHQNTR